MKYYLLLCLSWMAIGCENNSFQRGYVISQTAATLGETGIDEDASDLDELSE